MPTSFLRELHVEVEEPDGWRQITKLRSSGTNLCM